MSIAVDACAAQHQGDRKEQQDRVAILPHARKRGVALAVVADGMGGHTGGALAAEQVVHTAKTNLDQFSSTDEIPQRMLENSMHEAHTIALHERNGPPQHGCDASPATRKDHLGTLRG